MSYSHHAVSSKGRTGPLVAVQQLEDRRMLSAAPAVVDGVLTVEGTAEADRIIVSLNTSDPLATKLDVKLNDVVSSFNLDTVTSILISGGNGRDVITIDEAAGAIDVNAKLLGGNGKDVLTGGSGDDRLEGGNGKDVLVGGLGDDTLVGGRGKDKLDGGEGTNVLIQEKAKKQKKAKKHSADDNPGEEHRLAGHEKAKGQGHANHTKHH
jgi:Ca2+-binding RTX toxin-like protein